jgi:phage shock protein PspC (stress-responsive transcriptional regulator)
MSDDDHSYNDPLAPEGTMVSDDAHVDDTAPPETAASPSLHRSTTKRIFGGVAGGIAERFDVDVNIVRVVFAVLALVWGLGVVLYLAMWAIIPSAAPSAGDVAVNPDESSPRRVRWLRYALPIGLFIIAWIFLTSFGHFHAHNVVNTRFDKVLVLLWVLFLVALAVISLRAPSRRFTFGRFLGLVILAGISFVILTIGGFLIAVQVIGVPLEGGSGVKVWQPTAISQLQSSYHGAFGESTINLVHVPFTSGTWSITATEGVGVLIVEVPANAILDLRTHVGIGNVQSQTIYMPPSTTKALGAPHLDLNLQVGMGQIDVRRFVPVKAS